MTHASSAGDVFAALFAAHHVGDYWVQTSDQASRKGLDGPEGHLACARHVATMTATKAVALAGLHLSGRKISLKRAAAALAIDAASHYWADRRDPLAALADRLGKKGFYQLGSPREDHDDNPVLGTGANALDQAFHIAWLYAAAVITAERH